MSCANRISSLFQVTAVKSFLRYHGIAIVSSSTSRNFCTKSSPSPSGPVAVLANKCRSGEFRADEHQEKVMASLQKLYDTIQTYQPPEPKAQSSLFASWFPRKKIKSKIDDSIPKGLYIHGSVGGGKTTLMDLFYDCCKSVSCDL